MTPHRTIELNGGLLVLVDESDYNRVMAAGKWHPKPGRSGENYAHRNVKRGSTWTTETMHRFLTGWDLTDHINGNGVDNRRANLRQATKSQNLQNMHHHFGLSGFKGVSWHAKCQKWSARITLDRKTRSLGYFADPAEAARAYDRAAFELFGPFARPNFPTVVTGETQCQD